MLKRIAIITGSKSDMPIVDKARKILDRFNIDYEAHIISAHRTPERAHDFALNAAKNNFGIIIAVAGKAAHLGGVLASYTSIPVIGVPVKSDDLGGLDALLSTVQMPSGIPVATVAINGGENAAWLALRILAIENSDLAAKIDDARNLMAQEISEQDRILNS